MEYYLGAYYLLKLQKIDFGKFEESIIHTCSTCINDSYLNSWSISWTEDGKNVKDEVKSDFKLNSSSIKQLQTWCDKKLDEKEIGWINTFSSLATLLEYKDEFFKNEKDYQILSIYFSKSEKSNLLKLFIPPNGYGEIGLFSNLNNNVKENIKEEFLGYDLIGVEEGGDFHSFHCHNIADKLIEKFGIEINNFGLINDYENWNEIVDYMNDQSNGFESVPWFYVKIKRTNVK